MEIYEKIMAFINESQWIYHAFFIIFATLLIDFGWRKTLKHLNAKIQATQNRWDDAFFDAARLPTSAMIWLFGFIFAIQLAPHIKSSGFLPYVIQGREIISIALAAWFLVKFIQGVEQFIILDPQSTKSTFDQTSMHAISKLLRISVLVTAALMILETMGYSLKGVLAFGGIGGIAVGFASKDLLANFFGGLMIFLDRPFALGDWIRSPDRSIEGSVEHIGWRLTRIRTFDQRPLYIPNSVFTNIAVENPSRMTNRRIYETIGLRYDDIEQLPSILDDIEQMLRAHDEIDQNKTLMVNFDSYGDSALDFFVYTFTNTTNWIQFHKVKQDILLQIYSIIEQHSASIAYPTQRLLLDKPEGLDC